MNFRTKIIIIAVVVLLLLGGVVGFFIWRANQSKKIMPSSSPAVQPAAESGKQKAATAGEQPKAESRLLTAAQLGAAAREVAIKNRARDFVERFGSYSKDANYANFEELQPIITVSVAQWLKNYPKTLKEKEPAGFVGVTTFVVSQKINKADASSAEVLASVQREETTTDDVNRYYKDILVKLVLVGDIWKVDGAYWQ